MKSVMTHDFSKNPSISAPRSSFDRSCGYKTTFDAGWLIPFFTDDVLPGDTFTLETSVLARLSTPYFPIMDNIYMDTHYFFVPIRILWENSKRFFGEQTNPTDTIDYRLPYFVGIIPTEGSLSDYLELPVGPSISDVNALYHRAYNAIWNEWFRDQNLQDSERQRIDDGPDTPADYPLKKRGKRGDYFTSCLPWPQKGDAVTIPLGTSAPVVKSGAGVPTFDFSNQTNISMRSAADFQTVEMNTAGNSSNAISWNTTSLETDLTTATSSTINDLREAFQVQKLLERDARGGTRYSEIVRNHFGVDFYDVSYRPEYLGGGSSPLNVTQVHSTIGGAVGTLGELGAFATTQFSGHGFTKSFVEHGIIMGLVSVRADLTYQQGVPRRFLNSTRYDLYWPSLAYLGEQAVTNKEIYHQGTATDDLVFGYQERYAEYRYKNSAITGQFRSVATTPLDAWHLSQEFSALPVLGDTFIQEDPPIDRVIATPTEPHIIFDSYTKLRCARPMPMFGVPGLIDHF